MKLKNVIGLIVFIFVFIIACAGTSEKSGTAQLTEENESSNLNEPWTGTWKVSLGSGWQMGIVGDYELKLKQDGNQVKSLIGSTYNFKGKVDGNQLKGHFTDDMHHLLHRLTLEMSEDLKSFEGNDYGDGSFHIAPVKGVRQD